ncbi:endolytic transglycosylase MltG [Bifidobacterium oedipodis]|uniref:Endolytic murein transglycosylase n=1 Tax=Bifidobacterium oedipodis TaxID=2675322 RepID=A0A7Y0HSP1_9BIFI|nr:endolytic transglycosylase MltG [Bifidobacterium sp. DSM 109957]NMM93227.1 YceG family protein [Bifidobacterium sp. DSM 109957]
MSDGFDEFFDENTHWVEQGAPAAGSGNPPQPPKSRRDMRRRRAQHKRRHLIGIIAVVIVVALVVTGCFFAYGKLRAWRDARESSQTQQAADYAGPGDEDVSFTVQTGQSAGQIAQALYEADIIKSVAVFTSAVSANNATLYPGTFALKTHMKAIDVVKILSDQTQASGFLEVRAGERISDVIASAAELSGISKDEFEDVINGGGDGILPAEASGSFEGWFEPGTYNLADLDTASEIIKTLVDKRIAKLDDLGVPTGEERERILNIASIAEAEVNKSEYYGKVTRVIENRLEQDMTLGMDSTVAYGNNVSPSQITQAMLDDADNPYNTRQRKGLPPTPISSPGDNAITAAMNPEDGDWLFFVTTNLDTGETKFTSGSLDQQNTQFEQFVAELHQWEADNQ